MQRYDNAPERHGLSWSSGCWGIGMVPRMAVAVSLLTWERACSGQGREADKTWVFEDTDQFLNDWFQALMTHLNNLRSF